ncbi:hypothetical protein DASC09_037190 [Saccharomycopsis crataegensis]|uniref:Uncharacterized protein n=1 Tax=Saccharomycopsis crataegensis TaxID=43959 RepID=A0AAV5QNZ6_9ASCO|nr:hypothetical protein DASC09_037190 [Saccharomycopsis crataegensis]
MSSSSPHTTTTTTTTTMFYQQKLQRKNQKFFQRPIKTINAQIDELDIDYSNFENDEIPNDFICFNVPISQSLDELNSEYTSEHRNSSSGDSLSSANSSPILSDDSFIFPNLQNNSKAFNILDSEVQNLTLEFNSNVNFLKNEQLTQQKINKKKVSQITKKITKNEKFWISFLNECYKSTSHSSSANALPANILNKEFSNQFNIKVLNLMNKHDIYNNITSHNKSLNNLESNSLIKRSFSVSAVCGSTLHNNYNVVHNSNLTRNSIDSGDFALNVLDSDAYEMNSKSYFSTFGLNDLRYKKKYALPNNSSVDNLKANHSDLPISTSLYSIVNAASSTISIESNNSTFSVGLNHHDRSPNLNDSSSPRQNHSSESTPRSSVLSVNSIGSIFRTNSLPTTPSGSPKICNSPLLLGNSLPSWWSVGLSTSPLPTLLLKFSLSNKAYVNETIDSMNIRSIMWYLSSNHIVYMNPETFNYLNNEVNEFVRHFDYYIKLVKQIENNNEFSARNGSAGDHTKLLGLVKNLKQFLSNFEDKSKFQYQLSIFKSVGKTINGLKFPPNNSPAENVAIKNNLKLILLNFYFYLYDIGVTNVGYNKEIVSFTYVLLLNIRNNYFTFNCLLNLFNKDLKLPFLKYLLVEENTTTIKPENDDSMFTNDGSNLDALNDEQEIISMNSLKIFIKLLKNSLPDLYRFFKFTLNFNTFEKFYGLIKLLVRKIFNVENVTIDNHYRNYLERFLDILLMDKNNNLIVYLVIAFLKNCQMEFLIGLNSKIQKNIIMLNHSHKNNINNNNNNNQIENHHKIQKSIDITVKSFISEMHSASFGTQNLLFKSPNVATFINELKSELFGDLQQELTVDDIIEFQQLGIEC